MRKVRVDILLVERGLVESRSQAQRLVMAGQVRVDGQVVEKPSSSVSEDSQVQVEEGSLFVSRGGEKLEAGLRAFNLEVSEKICADVGASTGGFTDCLLQYGAVKVYAIDVGYGILHWKLRQDPRVVAMERTNVRYLEQLPEPVDFVSLDVSFISVKVILPVMKNWYAQAGGDAIVLVKPQFEAGRSEVSRGEGVIRDVEVHRRVLLDVLDFAQQEGYGVKRLIRSPLLGPKGNIEFLGWLAYPGLARPDLTGIIEDTLD